VSAVREAVKAVLVPWGWAEDHDPGHITDLIARLTEAVERVPVNVTIRDLDMSDSENIVTIWRAEDIDYLLAYVQLAQQAGGPLHFTVDGGYLKVKAGTYGTWCAPIKTEVYAG
jgi:hypothetical protein